MKSKKIISSIDAALFEVDNYTNEYCLEKNHLMIDINKVLNGLKAEFLKADHHVCKKTLKAFAEMYVLISLEYKQITFNDSIFSIYHQLEEGNEFELLKSA